MSYVLRVVIEDIVVLTEFLLIRFFVFPVTLVVTAEIAHAPRFFGSGTCDLDVLDGLFGFLSLIHASYKAFTYCSLFNAPLTLFCTLASITRVRFISSSLVRLLRSPVRFNLCRAAFNSVCRRFSIPSCFHLPVFLQ